MKDRTLLLGMLFIVAGIVSRFVPRASTGLGIFTILEVVGIVLVLLVIVRSWGRISGWVRARPTGKNVRRLCGVLLLAVCLQCGWAVVSDLRASRLYSPIEKDLARDDAGAAEALAAYLARERNPDTTRNMNAEWKVRILDRLAELPCPVPSSFSVTREAFAHLEDAENEELRKAALRALEAQTDATDIIWLIAELPGLSGEPKQLCGKLLESRTGQHFGVDSRKWRQWFGTTWGDVDEAKAFRLAEDAYEKFADRPDIRQMALDRIADGRGATKGQLLDLAGDADAALRRAAAGAIAARGDGGLARGLAGALKKETDPETAAAQARAVAALDPPVSLLDLVDAQRTAVGEAGREAAGKALADALGVAPGKDATAHAALLYRKLPKGSRERNRLFDDLLGGAVAGPEARRELAVIAVDKTLPEWDRVRALRRVIETGATLLDGPALAALAAEAPGTDLSKEAAKEIERRKNE